MLEIDWPLLLLCLGGSMAGGLVIFHAVAAYYHVRYYVRRRDDAKSWKIQAKRWLRADQQRDAVLLSTFNLSLGGLLSGLIVYSIAQGWQTPVYMDVAEHGWTYTLLSAVGMFIVNDAGAYYVHRALHTPWLYRHVHRHHHRFVATTPYVTVAVHPFELLALQTAALLPIFFVPLHPAVIGGVLIYVLIFNVIDHSGVRLTSSLPWQGPSMYHDDHHTQFHCNFGQHLTVWDRLHGTLRRKKRKYGVKVFGGGGERVADGGVEQDEFVAY